MAKTRKLLSSAPTRIDLAGGTVDIWPLYLLHENAATINLAIDLPATARFLPRSDPVIDISSVDQGVSIRAENLDALQGIHGLNLIRKIIQYYRPATGFELTTECAAPAGSGLGGSSALAIALSGALNEIAGANMSTTDIIQVTADLEASTIAIPTGKQDYYPAMYGGLTLIRWRAGSAEVEHVEPPKNFFDRLVLCYTGQARFSGTTNWEITRARIDGDKSVIRKLDHIVETAWQMRDALRKGSIDAAARVLEEEWENRKNLAPGVSTERIEELLQVAKEHGALAGKVCGAGGGGCVVLITAEGRKHEVEVNLLRRGVQLLPVAPDNVGLKLRWETV